MTRIKKLAAAAMLATAAVGLGGCATGLPTKVSRFNAMPAPAGQSFAVVPARAADVGGLQFARYAAVVADAMRAQGYAQAPSPAQATMLVRVDYGVDEGTTEIVREPMLGGRYGYGFGPYGFYRPWHFSRFGYYGSPYAPFYYGWDYPFYGAGDYGISSRTVYRSHLDVDIRRRSDNVQLFDGRAQARSRTDDLNALVPNLVTAMFTNFPGRNGETVRITVAPPGKAR